MTNSIQTIDENDPYAYRIANTLFINSHLFEVSDRASLSEAKDLISKLRDATKQKTSRRYSALRYHNQYSTS